jgi:hypothetical protein
MLIIIECIRGRMVVAVAVEQRHEHGSRSGSRGARRTTRAGRGADRRSGSTARDRSPTPRQGCRHASGTSSGGGTRGSCSWSRGRARCCAAARNRARGRRGGPRACPRGRRSRSACTHSRRSATDRDRGKPERYFERVASPTPLPYPSRSRALCSFSDGGPQ